MEIFGMDRQQEWRYSPYTWHQSHDQATVLLMIPFEATEEDISVTIDCNYIFAGVSGQAPIIKGRLYGQVDPIASSWQLEYQPHPFRPSPRERTTSTTSVTSATSASTHSSYAFISDPEMSSSFAASLENRDASPSPVLSSPSDRSFTLHQQLLIAPHHSRPVSPRNSMHSSSSSSFASLDSLSPNAAAGGHNGKLLTLHLEKSQTVIWPSLIIGPAPDTLTPSGCSPITAVGAEVEQQYNMDPTSLTLIALELLDIRMDREEAFECFLRAWHLAHVPTATMKLVSCYFPIYTSYDIPDSNMSNEEHVQRGTQAYYLQCIGGRTGLARLYIEAGMLYLEGTASGLISSSHSSLASIRMPLPPYGSATVGHSASGTEVWRRDRVAAARFFERARILQPGLETPMLPLSAPGSAEEMAVELEMQMQMPSIELDSALRTDPFSENHLRDRRRRGKGQEDAVQAQEGSRSLVGNTAGDVDSTWYMLLPSLVGAGTALVIVGVVGVLSFSWSRRNQGS
ncbi:hypothetical protein C8J55DRAFT_498206 [Lentinula edodes]|uniref:CS domain-containing protein n=1 Tax=Lentinula lateritia TaxID=40482 RepID=A0A9W9E1M0_9AGAR|nr:hypothetical protein C8J55DRAFT_498206 [Lentinula edodes]